MAEKANQDGNTHYKAGDLFTAAKCYEKADSMNPAEPKYSSNLSATLYEQGKYDLCVQAIIRSWDKLNLSKQADESKVALRVKLATRFAKANLHGVSNGMISPQSPSWNNSSQADIRAFAGANLNVKQNEETSLVWTHWNIVRGGLQARSDDEQKDLIVEANKRLRNAPIFKLASDPTPELYHFGHDRIRSLLDGIDGKYAINLDALEKCDARNLTFLFGGSGDARHVFGTLIDIVGRTKQIRTTKKKYSPPQVHMTLIDVHPATIARSLIVLELIRRITDLEGDFNGQLPFQTALASVYLSLVIPDYDNETVMEVAGTLAKHITENISDALPAWLHLNPQSMQPVVEALNYWSTPLDKSTKTLLELHKNLKSQGRGYEVHGHMPVGNIPPHFNPPTEDAIFDSVRVLLPPKPLLGRHHALEKLVGSYKTAAPEVFNAARKEVRTTWKPNPTLFDKYSTEHPMLGQVTGYPIVTMDHYQTLLTLQDWNRRMDPSMTMLAFGSTAFAVLAEFFRHVVDSIELLNAEGKLKIELVCAEATSGLAKLIAGDLGQRPDDFPQTFSRVWLSNIPDYTNGILNTAIHILPYHAADSQTTSVNCLLNTVALGTANGLCYNYTFLSPNELPQFLGCRLLSPSPNERLSGSIITLAPLALPLPLDKLASKAKIYHWLSQILLCTLSSGTPMPSPRRVDLPNNLNAFFRLLVHLLKMGYPSHWIGEFVGMILEDRLVTTARPYTGRLPIPSSERSNVTDEPRKVHLGPWLSEVEVIAADMGPALPFCVPPTMQDIRTYRAKVRPVNLRTHKDVRNWAQLASPFVMTVGLILYPPSSGYVAEDLAGLIPSIIEGGKDDSKLESLVGRKQVQFVLCAQKVDLSAGKEGIVEWRMGRKWYERMKAEKWEVAAYRTDLKIAASEPLGSDLWEEID